jgi:methionine synthase I (cobalamin-dependent)
LCYDAFVRTTLDISDDAYQIAKTVAREQKRSLGSVVSDFITGELGGSSPSPAASTESHFFPTFRSRRRTTMEDVRAAVDDDE